MVSLIFVVRRIPGILKFCLLSPPHFFLGGILSSHHLADPNYTSPGYELNSLLLIEFERSLLSYVKNVPGLLAFCDDFLLSKCLSVWGVWTRLSRRVSRDIWPPLQLKRWHSAQCPPDLGSSISSLGCATHWAHLLNHPKSCQFCVGPRTGRPAAGHCANCPPLRPCDPADPVAPEGAVAGCMLLGAWLRRAWLKFGQGQRVRQVGSQEPVVLIVSIISKSQFLVSSTFLSCFPFSI